MRISGCFTICSVNLIHNVRCIKNQGINYIYRNLDKSISVEEIAEQCCFSKYYFNRMFKVIVGENKQVLRSWSPICKQAIPLIA
ncbi:DNA-binding transcriptional regulator SoxS [Sporomusa ovata DSM 2662]|uniref:AraC family transcriptional regulator n=1 Tax=Sporomusa ovata TaxID=2378 RepID=UPI0003883789|nr:transcriptional regulator AraC family [Sporomusa ovata DSM 2662]